MRKFLFFLAFIFAIQSHAQLIVADYSYKGISIIYQNCDDSVVYYLSPGIATANLKKSSVFYLRVDRMTLSEDTLTVFLNDTLLSIGSTKPYNDLFHKGMGLWVYDTLTIGQSVGWHLAFRHKMKYKCLKINYSSRINNGPIEHQSLVITYNKKRKQRKNLWKGPCDGWNKYKFLHLRYRLKIWD